MKYIRLFNFLTANDIYLQNSKTIVSNTSTGPVEPKIVSGWPEKNPYPMPHTNPETRDSIAAIFLPVASLSRPPNVIMGDKHAK